MRKFQQHTSSPVQRAGVVVGGPSSVALVRPSWRRATLATSRHRGGDVATSWLTREATPSRVPAMQRHRGLFVVILLLAAVGFSSWYATKTWEGWEYILDIVGKGDNMPIAGLIPIIAFFTYLSMDEAFRHDRLIKQGREDEILDEMYK
jgi:hypothetical protein